MQGGHVAVPQKPGPGIEIDEKALAQVPAGTISAGCLRALSVAPSGAPARAEG
jgi:hypothetical protein